MKRCPENASPEAGLLSQPLEERSTGHSDGTEELADSLGGADAEALGSSSESFVDREMALLVLQEKIGHRFADGELLRLSLRHPSASKGGPVWQNNQRLEFLGDAILSALLAEALFKLYPEAREGDLSRWRALLVRGPHLACVARTLNLADCVELAPAEDAQGGRARLSILEDALEALIGALYLDAGWEAVHRLVLPWFAPLEERLRALDLEDNPKGRLQEWLQLHGPKTIIFYQVTGIEGPDHARGYRVTLYLSGQEYGQGFGSSKKEAEEQAARMALRIILNNPTKTFPQT